MENSMRPLMERIADTLQRQHDLIAELRALDDEFNNTIEGLSVKTMALQARFEPPPATSAKVVQMPKIEPDENFLPNVLKGGPNKREP